MSVIKNETAVQKILESNGAMFKVTFIKRTDGSVRVMNARTGVTKFTTKEGMSYDPIKKNLVPVFDMDLFNEEVSQITAHGQRREDKIAEIGPRCYRMVNLEAIVELKIAGDVFVVEGDVHEYMFEWKGNGGVAMSKVVTGRNEGEAKVKFKREVGLNRMPTRCTISDRGVSVQRPVGELPLPFWRTK